MPHDENTIHAQLQTLKNKPEAMKLGLERMHSFFKKHPINTMPCPLIIVCGTNGKGSCVETLTQLYLSQGYTVGSYTSPHINSITERICLNGKPISAEDFLNALNQCMQYTQSLSCSYFEMLTLTACQFFQNHPCDVLVFEIGLGGRLDAVNALEPDLSIITTIDLDHQHYLGNSRDAIGLEKAAIARPNKPIIYASHNPPTSLKNYLRNLQAKTLYAQKDYHWTNDKADGWSFTCAKTNITLPPCHLPLPSVAAALAACYTLQDKRPLSHPNQIPKAIAQAKLPGRFEIIRHRNKTIILDVAHNPEAGRYLNKKLMAYRKKNPYRKLIALWASMADKDHQGLCLPLIDSIDTWHLTTFGTPNAASTETLKQSIQKRSPKAHLHTHQDLSQAYEKALANTTEKDALLVFGSFITVAHIQSYQPTFKG